MPQGSLDVKHFFYDSTLEERMEILRRNKVDYVMSPKKSSLVDSLKEQPGFTPVDTPSERYFLFVVDSEKLPCWKILTGTKPGGDHSVKCSSLDLPFRRELC